MSDTQDNNPNIDISRYAIFPQYLKYTFLIFIISGIGAFLFYSFNWSIRGWVLHTTTFYYFLYATFFSMVFVALPMRKKDKARVPWYDIVLSLSAFILFLYLTINGRNITQVSWVNEPTLPRIFLATITALLSLEAGRRMAGLPFSLICLFFGVYPLFAESMPGLLWGFNFPFSHIVTSFTFSVKGLLGLPSQVLGEILLGYLIFAGVLMATGGGGFFLKLATALMGRFRGGPAKVAVLASGFFGSLTGTPVENIIATGSFTIPAMKKLGYTAHYAAAIEAVASSGGVIMPPVMGTIAFIMAIITGIPYSEIVIAAIIPAILYYWGLLVQVDSYAGRVGLRGIPPAQIPSLRETLKEGWPFLAALVFLIVGLLYFRWDAKAPVYASGLLLLISFTNRRSFLTPSKLAAMIALVGSLITYLIAAFAIVGLLLTGLYLPGSITALTAHLVSLAGSNLILILLIAVVLCYVFGMVGISLVAYIVLAVIAVPALVTATGVNVVAIHFFFIYFLLTAGITPPVAISAFVAAAIAGAPPMKTGFLAMRLAIVLYFVPFFFVFNPSLILQGPVSDTLILFFLCILGIWILASGLEGYILLLGRLRWWHRVVFVTGGFLIAFPARDFSKFTDWLTTIIGLILCIVVFVIWFLRKQYKNRSSTY